MEGSAATPTVLLARLEALADPTRLRLLRLLERHELGVVELIDVLQLPQSTVSRHLKLLSDQGFLRAHSRGTANLYGLRGDELDPAARKLWLLLKEQTAQWATARQDELRLEARQRQKPGAAQAFFARTADEWDRLRAELYGGAFGESALAALLPRNAVVYDLACGTGALIAQLAPQVGQVVGVDNSAAMLRGARRRVAGFENVELRQGELEHLPLDDGSGDAALLVLALTYLTEPGQALVQAARVLKPGGRLVIVDLLRHDRDQFRRELGQVHKGFEPKELEDLLITAGFEHARVAPLPPEPKAKGPALVLASADRSQSFVSPSLPRSARAGQKRGRSR